MQAKAKILIGFHQIMSLLLLCVIIGEIMGDARSTDVKKARFGMKALYMVIVVQSQCPDQLSVRCNTEHIRQTMLAMNREASS